MAMSKQNIFFVHTCLILRKQTWWKSDLYRCKPLLWEWECVCAQMHVCVLKSVFTFPAFKALNAHRYCCGPVHLRAIWQNKKIQGGYGTVRKACVSNNGLLLILKKMNTTIVFEHLYGKVDIRSFLSYLFPANPCSRTLWEKIFSQEIFYFHNCCCLV